MERLFETSFVRTANRCNKLLAPEGQDRLQLADVHLDTGKLTKAGEYRMADNVYAKLAQDVAAGDPSAVDESVRRNILAFHADMNRPNWAQTGGDEWRRTLAAVGKLRWAGGATRVQQ